MFSEQQYGDGLEMLAESLVEMIREDAEDAEAEALLAESYTADTIIALQERVKELLT